MGESGRHRVEQELSWEMSRRELVRFYDLILDTAPQAATSAQYEAG